MRAALQATFVAELGGGEPGTVYMARAKCTRCIGPWMGPKRTTSRWLKKHPGESWLRALEEVRAQAVRDVLAHCDRAHAGRLRG